LEEKKDSATGVLNVGGLSMAATDKQKEYNREYMRFYYRVKSIFNNIHKYNLTEEEQRKLIDIARIKEDVFVTYCEIAELRKNGQN